jgi:hypothetical protein
LSQAILIQFAVTADNPSSVERWEEVAAEFCATDADEAID